ncbi:MAG: class I SAM-dependent methyltransferase [Pseudomonadota bacterium]
MINRGLMYAKLSFYTEKACLFRWRSELIKKASGDVLEIGPGTGLNLTHYQDIDSLYLLEPDKSMRQILTQQLAASDIDNRIAYVESGHCEHIPLESNSIDTVVATLVLCSVTDVECCLSEIHRVLKPNGSFVFLEHVGAVPHDSACRVWQNRITPLWKRVVDNCHLNRDTEALIAARFTIASITHDSMRNVPPIFRPSIRGIAIKNTEGIHASGNE